MSGHTVRRDAQTFFCWTCQIKGNLGKSLLSLPTLPATLQSSVQLSKETESEWERERVRERVSREEIAVLSSLALFCAVPVAVAFLLYAPRYSVTLALPLSPVGWTARSACTHARALTRSLARSLAHSLLLPLPPCNCIPVCLAAQSLCRFASSSASVVFVVSISVAVAVSVVLCCAFTRAGSGSRTTQHLQTERCRKWKWISRDRASDPSRAEFVVDHVVIVVVVVVSVTVHVYCPSLLSAAFVEICYNYKK